MVLALHGHHVGLCVAGFEVDGLSALGAVEAAEL
jgi:hypothetical protein